MLLSLLESSLRSYPNYDDNNYNLDELIIRYNDHSSLHAIKNKCVELNSTFTFKRLTRSKYPLQLND